MHASISKQAILPTFIAVGAKGCLGKWAARVKKSFKITYEYCRIRRYYSM